MIGQHSVQQVEKTGERRRSYHWPAIISSIPAFIFCSFLFMGIGVGHAIFFTIFSLIILLFALIVIGSAF